ncbi:hypothetical protein DX130_01560 [Paenibacillus paeoniae]|uniref:Uncharacterized protein n=1 Tax=Paenibacillus paeoniae TaxID=2292705 RepID=A0A371PI36_9BACL|nr:hypothetical protein DX130_01560 [Paenibacillus paeoniae]
MDLKDVVLISKIEKAMSRLFLASLFHVFVKKWTWLEANGARSILEKRQRAPLYPDSTLYMTFRESGYNSARKNTSCVVCGFSHELFHERGFPRFRELHFFYVTFI